MIFSQLVTYPFRKYHCLERLQPTAYAGPDFDCGTEGLTGVARDQSADAYGVRPMLQKLIAVGASE